MALTHESYLAAIAKFSPEASRVGESALWIAVLRPKQITVGSLVLLPKRPIEDFGQVKEDEATDLFRAIAGCQALLRSTFAPDRFNLIAAMMKDPFVHFHLIPRYSTPRTVDQVTVIDEDWPALVDFAKPAADDEVRNVVLTCLRDALGGRAL